MPDSESLELLRKIRRGDSEAFRRLFDRWYTPMCRHALMFVGDEQVAEDIVQELFIRLWIRREQLNITTSVRSYLYRSVRKPLFELYQGFSCRSGPDGRY
jgi:DNA-directed RNA polymerase specialized sigma24 family protein